MVREDPKKASIYDSQLCTEAKTSSVDIYVEKSGAINDTNSHDETSLSLAEGSALISPTTPRTRMLMQTFRDILRRFMSIVNRRTKTEELSASRTRANSLPLSEVPDNIHTQPRINKQRSLIEHSVATIRSASILHRTKTSHIELLDETWEDWLVFYQCGEANLSDVSRPTCFNGFGYMAAPVHKLEKFRLRAVEKVTDDTLWSPDLGWLKAELRSLLIQCRLRAACVSIIDQSTQQNKLEIGLGRQVEILGRELSIDAHTILSKEYFALLDASRDWRTRFNPLVHGPPFTKFYCGVPIFIENMPVGCISVCDPYVKIHLVPEVVKKLQLVSKTLSAKLGTRLLQRGSAWYLPRIRGENGRAQDFDSDYVGDKKAVDDLVESSNRAFAEDSVSEQYSISSEVSSSSQRHMPNRLMNLPFRVYGTKLQPLSCKYLKQPFEVFESLMKCQTVMQAIKKSCKLVMENIGADVVYVAEIRTKELTAADEARRREFEARGEHLDIRVRLVGHCTPATDINIANDMQRNKRLLGCAIISQYGLQYSLGTEENSEESGSGVIIPFRRNELQPCDANMFSGGFAMCALKTKLRAMSPGDKSFMKSVVRALENILNCHEELQKTSK